MTSTSSYESKIDQGDFLNAGTVRINVALSSWPLNGSGYSRIDQVKFAEDSL